MDAEKNESDSLARVELCWNGKAEMWNRKVGTEGDWARRHSDPILFSCLGKVEQLKILDAGCGTGYLSIKLAKLGARVTGIDLAPEMIKFAKENAQAAFVNDSLDSATIPEFSVCSIEDMRNFEDNSFDRVVSNYVLQDTPDIPPPQPPFLCSLSQMNPSVNEGEGRGRQVPRLCTFAVLSKTSLATSLTRDVDGYPIVFLDELFVSTNMTLMMNP